MVLCKWPSDYSLETYKREGGCDGVCLSWKWQLLTDMMAARSGRKSWGMVVLVEELCLFAIGGGDEGNAAPVMDVVTAAECMIME